MAPISTEEQIRRAAVKREAELVNRVEELELLVKKLQKELKKKRSAEAPLTAPAQDQVVKPDLTQLGLDFNPRNHYESPGKRGYISPERRVSLWKRFNGNVLTGNCMCCNDILHYCKFEIGHGQAVARGGGIDDCNLVPICGHCNSVMRDENMARYVVRYNIQMSPLYDIFYQMYHTKRVRETQKAMMLPPRTKHSRAATKRISRVAKAKAEQPRRLRRLCGEDESSDSDSDSMITDDEGETHNYKIDDFVCRG